MDCFFAAIECRDEPSIADKPVGVGGRGGRGVLTTCNYPARAFGCRSAMPVFKALQLCPQLIIKPVRFEHYREESRQIRAILSDYTQLIEPVSLDEAYLDVSHRPEYAWDLAREIRERIRAERHLTASAGIAPNKMLAKIASDWRKPDGQFAITPDKVAAFMIELPVRRIPGIGPKAAAKLAERGIETCGQLQQLERYQLHELFGVKWGGELFERCRGIDDDPVTVRRVRKSLSNEHTFAHDLDSLEQCRRALHRMLDELASDLAKRENPRFTRVFVKLKFANFQTTTREGPASALDRAVFDSLLAEAFGRSPHNVRLIGVGVRFPVAAEDDVRQLGLFGE